MISKILFNKYQIIHLYLKEQEYNSAIPYSIHINDTKQL